MEAVKAFNNELYSLNEYKPPISRAKMNQVTKAAIKAIKFYKHVVQSVEKFVQKCKPEYKVPGLYVIDSIVRQSRHQFGPEKDVFAPRFCKNINTTFQNLYKCPADDKSKVVRVLNLWQKNSVFKSEVIQPLLDMAAGIPPPSVTPAIASTAATVSSNTPGTPATPATPANVVQNLPDSWASISQMSNTDTIAAVAQLLQSPQGQQLQQLVQSLQMQQQKPQPSLLQALDAGLVVQLQALTAQLTAAATAANTLNPLEQRHNFNKKLLDRFEYDEEHDRSDEIKKETPPSQLPLVTETMNTSLFQQLAEQFQQQNFEQFRQQLMEQQQQQQQTQQNTTLDNQEVTFGSEKSVTPSQGSTQLHQLEQEIKMEIKMEDSLEQQQQDMDIDAPDGQETIEEEIFEQEDKKPIIRSRSRTRSQSRSRSPRKKRSRSRSGSRKRKHRKRSRSRSKERKRKSSRSYSSERRAKERQRKGLPPVRSKTLSVCSTTLWVGQVDKKATQQDITNLFEEFGQIESINMIPPRGCAYVSMVHRQDAHNTLQELSTGSFKMGSKIIKIAWALNKGVKPEYKQFWDVDLGVTYIPWEKVKLDDLAGFSEGGMIDQETVNSEWKSRKSTSANENVPQTSTTDSNTQPTSQAEAFTQPVTMLPVQIPVVPTVSGVGIVQPPNFPLSMSIPPPGFNPAIPPPPFLRPGFNPTQPPPGYLPPPVVPLPAVPSIPAVQSSLVHSSLSTTQDGAKDSPFGNLLSHIGSGPSSLTTPGIQPGSMFNQVGSQAPPAGLVGSSDLATSRSVNQTSSSDTVSTTGPGNQSAASSGPALGMQPSTAGQGQGQGQGQGPQSLPPPNMTGPRMPGGLPLDMRSGMMPPSPGQRFPLLMPPQPNMPPSLAMDGALQSGPRGSFLPGSPFSRPEGAFVRSGVPSVDSGTNTNPNHAPGEERRSSASESSNFQRDSMQQEGDRDYRFPPVEGRDGVGRREQFGYGHDHRWGSRDFDERERRGMPFGPKVFHDDHDRYSGRNFRFDGRSGPMWNRGFDQEAHRDFDDRSRPWERQRDRDDRDFAFRRDVNGSRFGRDRETDHWVPPRQRFDYFQGTTERQKPDDRPRVNGDFSETDSQPPTEEIENSVPEMPAKLDSPTDENEEKSDLENPPVTENKDNEET